MLYPQSLLDELPIRRYVFWPITHAIAEVQAGKGWRTYPALPTEHAMRQISKQHRAVYWITNGRKHR